MKLKKSIFVITIMYKSIIFETIIRLNGFNRKNLTFKWNKTELNREFITTEKKRNYNKIKTTINLL